MEIVCQKQALLRALNAVAPACAAKSAMPVLACVLLDAHGGALTVRASNTYTAIRTVAEASVKDSGAMAVNAKTLGDIVKHLPEGAVTLKQDKAALRIVVGKIKFRVPSMPAEDFPPMPTAQEGAPAISVKASDFSALLKAVGYAASHDDTRAHLAGINLSTAGDRLTAVATDGHRLALSSCELAGGSFKTAETIAQHALDGVRRLVDKNAGPVNITVSSHLHVRSGDTEIAIARVDAPFPPYDKVVPKSHTRRVVVSRDLLVSAIKRIALVAGEKSGGVRFNLAAGVLEVVSENADTGDGSEELDVDYAGDQLTIGFSAQYLIEALGAVLDDDVALELGGNLEPGVIKGAKDTATLGVVMPMRVG